MEKSNKKKRTGSAIFKVPKDNNGQPLTTLLWGSAKKGYSGIKGFDENGKPILKSR